MLKTYIITLFFFGFYSFCYSQERIATFYEEILPLSETNYQEAIRLWDTNYNNVNADPRNRLLMIACMWDNYDVTRLKKEIIYLTEHHGFDIESSSLNNKELYNTLTTGELSNWYFNMKKVHKKIWAINNYDKINDLTTLSTIYYVDQNIITNLFSYVLHSKTKNDSILVDSIYMNLNTQNFWELIKLCKKNSELPTSFNYAINTSGVVDLILLHNTYSEYQLIEKWSAIWEYLVVAYNEEKIDNSFLHIFDKSMHHNYGVQYYGLLGDEVLIDKDSIANLCPFNLKIKVQ